MNNIFDASALVASRQPDLIDEVDTNTTYLGFLQRADTTKCLILRILKTGTVTTFQYPNGSLEFNQDWNQRTTLTYNYKR